MHHLSKQNRIERRNFGGLEHHGATCCDCGRNLRRDLVERPVPGSDQRTDTDRLMNDAAAADVLFPFKGLQRLERMHQMAQARRRLRGRGQAHRRTHLLRHRSSNFGHAGLVDRNDFFQQSRTLFDRGLRKSHESAARSGHRTIDVGFVADGNRGDHGFGRRIDHSQGLLAVGLDPLAVDIELLLVFHDVSGDVWGS